MGQPAAAPLAGSPAAVRLPTRAGMQVVAALVYPQAYFSTQKKFNNIPTDSMENPSQSILMRATERSNPSLHTNKSKVTKVGTADPNTNQLDELVGGGICCIAVPSSFVVVVAAREKTENNPGWKCGAVRGSGGRVQGGIL